MDTSVNRSWSSTKIAEHVRHVSQNKACQGLKQTGRDIGATGKPVHDDASLDRTSVFTSHVAET